MFTAVDIFPHAPSLADEFDCAAPFGELRKHFPVVLPMLHFHILNHTATYSKGQYRVWAISIERFVLIRRI
ncbi:hypothetical protein GHT06_018609 [Daphnia sinensis]|uniref:Uncharacterized protein n=1 Tax=Daphnia sinensis TaxID=1820382 RepID=A0AAD5KP10_9CRUS|nr:hypothetical protein GHT06_018609 [Daphnia sinensis]